MTTLDFAKSILLDEDKYGPNLCEIAKALVDSAAELDEARRIGLSMCRRAHDLVTIAGTGEYGSINEARARLEGVQDVRDLATLLKDSEERARNSERACEAAHARIATLTEERDRALLYMSSDDVPASTKLLADVVKFAKNRLMCCSAALEGRNGDITPSMSLAYTQERRTLEATLRLLEDS